MTNRSSVQRESGWRMSHAVAFTKIRSETGLIAVIVCLPLVNALLFATHSFPLRPAILNLLFDLELIYLFAEIGIIFWARVHGMSYKAEFLRLDTLTRYALIGFLGTFWISSAFLAPVPIYSIIRASYWIIHIFFVFSVAYFVRSADRQLLRKLSFLLPAGFLLLAAGVYAHLLSAPASLFEPTKDFFWSAIVPGFLSIRHFGMLAGFVSACWLGYCLSIADEKLPVWLIATVTSLLFAALFWSGTRSALLGMGTGIIATFVFARKWPLGQPLVAVVVAALIGAILSKIWLPPDSSFGIFDPARFAVGGGSDAASGRSVLWMAGIQHFLESPLLGWGEGSFYHLYLIDGKGHHLQPHNFIIQFLLSWGIIAGGIALVMMAKTLFRLHWNLHRTPLAIAPLAALDCILVIAMLDGALFTLRTIVPAILFWIVAERLSAADAAKA